MRGTILFLMLISCQLLSGQILCIKCFDQNDSISSNVHNLIKNGGFENTTCIGAAHFCPNSFGYSCDIMDWKCTGGGSATYCRFYDSTSSVIPEGTKAVYLGNSYAHSCSSIKLDTSCLKNNSCSVSGVPAGFPQNDSTYGGPLGVSLEQTVSNLIPGNVYVLEFWVGGERTSFGFTRNGLFAVDIGFGNVFLRNKPTDPFPLITGTTFIIEFKASTTDHKIKFTNWGHICTHCTELVLDNVRLYTLAELSPSVTRCFTATNNLNENVSIELYPNPFSNELLVTSNDFDQKEIYLYDITSRKLLQRSFTNSISINTENLSPGLNIYEVRYKNGLIKNGKVLKN